MRLTHETRILLFSFQVLFALLALAGDLGCMSGPAVVGLVADASEGNMTGGLLLAILFPVLLGVGLLIHRKANRQSKH